MAIWYIVWPFSGFGMVYQEKSGNPGGGPTPAQQLQSLCFRGISNPSKLSHLDLLYIFKAFFSPTTCRLYIFFCLLLPSNLMVSTSFVCTCI
jgi:hypothetical protein